jgi:hypothetical protein
MAGSVRAGKPHITLKPHARIIAPPIYNPELDALGLKLNEDGHVVAQIDCPDPDPVKLFTDPNAVIDARLWEGRFDRNGRLRESRVTPRMTGDGIEQRYTRLRETLKLTEADWFSLGGPAGFGAPEGPLTSNYVPLIPGPWTRQQYWADYWASSAKCFEASTHSGIARRTCAAMTYFTLGRGISWKFSNDKAQQAWEQFWKGNKMRRRIKSIARDLSVFGEQFLRYFPAPRGDPRLLIVRQLDPATIYEIVSDQEDLETVYFYHQQFQTRMEYYSPPRANKAPQGPTPAGVTRYIIRQIDASEIDHYALHTVSGEARGRSDLFPVLGDLKRLRDLMTAKVVQSDIGNRVMAVLKANGTNADINRVLNSIFPNGQPPPPGTIVGLNNAVDLEPFQYSSGREVRADFTYDELLDSIASGVGIGRQYLGFAPSNGGSGSTRANALNEADSSVKTFEDRQDVLSEDILQEMCDRVLEAAGINGIVEREFILPEIASEDTTTKLENLEIAMANNWVSHRTAASTAGAELVAEYDYDHEMEAIVEEFEAAEETDGKDELTGLDKPASGGKIRRRSIRATARQVPLINPTRAQSQDDEPLGVMVGPDGAVQPAAAPGSKDADQPGSPGSGSGRANIRQAVREAARNRRRLEDPEFKRASDDFAQRTAENLDKLLADL